MIPSPWSFEPMISDQDLARLGILTLRWSHIEHVLANCLKVMLRLNDDEAVAIIFPMNLETRVNRISEVLEFNSTIHAHVRAAFTELKPIMKGLSLVRNNVVHAIVVEHDDEGHIFHLRSKRRTLTKQQIFSVEELTNYAAHLVQAMRFGLGFKNDPEPVYLTWPGRPEIPEFLQSVIQWPKAQGTAGH